MLLFIASLFIPALTKQWNDRKQELDVKKVVLADVVRASTDAMYGAQDVTAMTDASEQSRARAALYRAWLRSRSGVETPMLVYFDDSEAADHWRGRGELGFRNAVLIYVFMSCCDPDRRNHVAMLKKYVDTPGRLPGGGDPWDVLGCGPGEKGCTPAANYAVAYRWLGNQLFAQQRVLRDQLLSANGAGFSTDWRDLVSDLNPLG